MPDAAESTLASRINRLFDIMRKPADPPLSNAAAATAIEAKTGVSISPAYLWQLRSGLKSNPTISHLRAIAEYFGVPASYLIDEGEDPSIEAQLLGIEDLGEDYMASVEFNGMIREQPSAGPSPFREVWNMTKPKNGQVGWLVAGVQALQ